MIQDDDASNDNPSDASSDLILNGGEGSQALDGWDDMRLGFDEMNSEVEEDGQSESDEEIPKLIDRSSVVPASGGTGTSEV